MCLHKTIVSMTWHVAAVDQCHTAGKNNVVLLCLLQAWVHYEDEYQITFLFADKCCLVAADFLCVMELH